MAKSAPGTSGEANYQDAELAEQHEVGKTLWRNPAFQERLSGLLEINKGRNPRRRLILGAYLLGESASSLQPDELRVLASLREMEITPHRLADHIHRRFLEAEAHVEATRDIRPFDAQALATRAQLATTLALPAHVRAEVGKEGGKKRKPWVDTRRRTE